jgi:hypothetical protein
VNPEIWRPRIKTAAGWTILLALIALGYACWAGSYMNWLVAFFFLILGVSHLIYAKWDPCPVIAVRLIDYLYVGFGTAAVFLAVWGQHERETYLRALAQLKVNFYAMFLPVSPSPAILGEYIAKDLDRFCINKSQVDILKGRPNRRSDMNSDLTAAERREISTKFCDWSRHVRGVIAKDPSISELTKEINMAPPFFPMASCELAEQARTGRTWQERMEQYQKPLLGQNPSEELERTLKSVRPQPLKQQMRYLLFCNVDNAGESIVSVLSSMLDNKRLAEPLPPQSPDSTGYGIFRTIVWPFFAAIALALRLTKVTADVTDWAIRQRQ